MPRAEPALETAKTHVKRQFSQRHIRLGHNLRVVEILVQSSKLWQRARESSKSAAREGTPPFFPRPLGFWNFLVVPHATALVFMPPEMVGCNQLQSSALAASGDARVQTFS